MNLSDYRTPRAPSRVVGNNQAGYDSWLSDYNNRRDSYTKSLAAASAATPSFHDNLVTSVGDWFNNQYGTPDNSTVSDADRVKNWFTTYTNAEKAFEPTQWASVDPQFTTGAADPGALDPYSRTPVQSAVGMTFGGNLYNDIAGYTPATPAADYSQFDAEKTQMDQKYNDYLDQQKNIQNAYSAQRGGGYAGGLLPSNGMGNTFSAFGSLDGGTSSSNGTSGDGTDANFAPWNSLAYKPGGLGSLGQYNPNPWNTAGPSNRAQSGWGGIFSNRNPFALTG